jgi:hypothetical protein
MYALESPSYWLLPVEKHGDTAVHSPEEHDLEAHSQDSALASEHSQYTGQSMNSSYRKKNTMAKNIIERGCCGGMLDYTLAFWEWYCDCIWLKCILYILLSYGTWRQPFPDEFWERLWRSKWGSAEETSELQKLVARDSVAKFRRINLDSMCWIQGRPQKVLANLAGQSLGLLWPCFWYHSEFTNSCPFRTTNLAFQ